VAELAPDTTDPTGAQGGAPGSFDRDTAIEHLPAAGEHDGRAARASYAARLDPEWSVFGRPHGGYVTAIVLRALTAAVGDDARAARSLTVHFPRPPRPGDVRIYAAVERAGRSLSTVSARMEQDGEVVALALGAFSLPRGSLEVSELPMPDVAPADPRRESSDEIRGRVERGEAPQFLRKVVMQPCGGGRPFGGADQPLCNCSWLGLAEAGRPLDAIALAFFTDANFPTPFSRLREPAGAPTVDLTVHFRAADALRRADDPGALCLTRFRSRVIHEGFFEEDSVIWAADGAVLAQSRQLALLVSPKPI
jgi:acyl-CoA thioesterase